MVLGLETRQTSLDHFNKWPYRLKNLPGPQGADSGYQVHQTSKTPLRVCKDSVENSIFADPILSAATDSDMGVSRLPTTNELLAPFSTSPEYITASDKTQLNSSSQSIELAEVGFVNVLTPDPRSSRAKGQNIMTTNETEVQARDHLYTFPSLTCRESTQAKRRRAVHDVDGPGTSHMSSKKRRLRLQLITSRLSQPFSLPATHILNRESDDDTPVISRFVKLAAIGAKKAGHQTALVRKAAILNRVRLNIRQTAVSRGHDRIWKKTGWGAMRHGFQLVTDSTGAMFPGRSGEQVPGPIVPRVWRPHTTGLNLNTSSTMQLPKTLPTNNWPAKNAAGSSAYSSFGSLRDQALCEEVPLCPPPTSIMTPLAGADEDEASFPDADLDSRYTETSDDEMDGVYADFGVLFGSGAGSQEDPDEDEHFYEEYLDEVDGITWSS